MKRKIFQQGLLIFLAMLLLAGCGVRPESRSGGNDAPSSTVFNSEEVPDTQTVGEETPEGTRNPLSDPGSVRSFLDGNGIEHGDIYLQDGLLYINIVGLTEEVENKLSATYSAGTYKTVSVSYTLQELEAAQQKLIDNDLFKKLNLYSSGIDVIKNKLTIQMPDSSEEKGKTEIEKLIDPEMISYVIEPLPEKPDVVGTIVEIDVAENRILIVEDGEEEPNYYFSFSEFSELYNEAGKKITFSDLKEEQKVRLWFSGAVATSLPALATTRRLEIVS